MIRHYNDAELQEYLDGRGGSGGWDALRAHLESCPACALRHRGLRMVDGGLRTLPLERPAHDLTLTVLARIQHHRRRTWLDVALDPRVLTAVVVGAFGLVVAGMMGLTALQQRGAAVTGPGTPPHSVASHIGGLIDAGTAVLTQSFSQLLSPFSLQMTLALGILVPLLSILDWFVTTRRVAR